MIEQMTEQEMIEAALEMLPTSPEAVIKHLGVERDHAWKLIRLAQQRHMALAHFEWAADYRQRKGITS